LAKSHSLKRRSSNVGKARRTRSRKASPKVVVGDPFTAEDIELRGSRAVESRTKSRIAMVLVVAFLIMYCLYIAHEWWEDKSFETIGQFIQTALAMFVGWIVGKSQRSDSS
jgi:hypothetical protein